MLKEVTEQDFQSTVDSGVTLVDFWAEWCGPCRMVTPVLEELQGELGDSAKIVKLNVDENPNIAQQFGISGIPTMLLFKDGQVVDKLVGASSINTYRDLINKQIA